MPLGQGFLNSWLKVNNKHVIIPNKNDSRADGKPDGSKQAKKNTESTRTVQTTKTVEDERSQIIRRFSNRKNKRRLHRTVSASDLIRDKLTSKGSKRFMDSSGDELEKDDKYTVKHGSGSTASSDFGSTRSLHHQPQQQSKQQQDESPVQSPPQKSQQEEQKTTSIQSSVENGSLRLVAGFFGADIDTLENRSLYSAQRDSASVVSRGGSSLPTRIKPKTSGIGIRFPPNIFALDNVAPEKSRQYIQLEEELAAAREDVEYLRGVALRNENETNENKMETSNRSGSMDDISSSQETEIEEMKKEWGMVQNDMQQEIQKYADLCVHLNEEAEHRNEEAMNLHMELNTVTRERDEVTTEVETLRARVAEYEKREREQRKAEEILLQYEERGLEFASREIGARDAIIEDLSTRLEHALDTLTLEREQQNQRRQIIFPNQPKQRTNQKNNNAATTIDLELKATREALRNAEQTIELLRMEQNGNLGRGSYH